MKKARAIFVAAIIIIVFGASAGAWYLNNEGYIGADKEASADKIAYDNDNDGEHNKNNHFGNNDRNDEKNGNDDENAERDDNQKENIAANKNETEAANNQLQISADFADVNEFLSVFSRVYFAENNEYSYDDHSNYDVLRFAYSHIFRTDRESVVTKRTDDSFGYYFGVSYDYVNDILDDYLGITIAKEDIYTENAYAFFKYDDGYFYTPAAEGIGYTNLAIADSITQNSNKTGYTISFTIYSDSVRCDMSASEAAEHGKKYASGTAEIEKSDNGFTLKSYKVII